MTSKYFAAIALFISIIATPAHAGWIGQSEVTPALGGMTSTIGTFDENENFLTLICGDATRELAISLATNDWPTYSDTHIDISLSGSTETWLIPADAIHQDGGTTLFSSAPFVRFLVEFIENTEGEDRSIDVRILSGTEQSDLAFSITDYQISATEFLENCPI